MVEVMEEEEEEEEKEEELDVIVVDVGFFCWKAGFATDPGPTVILHTSHTEAAGDTSDQSSDETGRWKEIFQLLDAAPEEHLLLIAKNPALEEKTTAAALFGLGTFYE